MMTNTVRPAAAWIRPTPPNPKARLRLLCLPYAGGGSTIFRNWAQALPPDVEVGTVLLPGRETRLAEPAHTRVETLVPELASGLATWLDRPYALFGHSMGALLSFELARELRRAQLPLPAQLFLSAHRAPQLDRTARPIHDLPETEFIAELRQLNGTPAEVLQHAELMELLLPLLRADFALCETYRYRPEPSLPCPLTIFGGLDDISVAPRDLEGWEAQTSAGCSLRLFPGDHFFLNASPAPLLQAVSEELRLLLDRLA